jgi:hypothetical protein
LNFNFFYLFFVKLSQSYDLDREFNKIILLTQVFFFQLSFFLQLHNSIFYWLKIRPHDLFWFAYIRLYRSHDPSYGFGKLTRVIFFSYFFNWFFFKFHPLTLNWLRIIFHNLFRLTLSMRLSRSYDPDHEFGGLTWADSCFFF